MQCAFAQKRSTFFFLFFWRWFVFSSCAEPCDAHLEFARKRTGAPLPFVLGGHAHSLSTLEHIKKGKRRKKSSKKPNTLMPSSVPKCDTESGSAATTWAQEVQLDVHSRASAKRGKKIETLLACTGKP